MRRRFAATLATLLVLTSIHTGAPSAAASSRGARQQGSEPAHPDKAVCTVCAGRSAHGSDPDPEPVAGTSVYEGTTYAFCSLDCKAEFDANPAWWATMELPFPVPELRARGLDGEVTALPIGDGRPTVLDFWATWCQPCKKTMRALQERFEALAGDPEGLRIVGVSIDEGDGALDEVRRYVKKQRADYPIFLDDQELPAWVALRVRAVPTIMLLDGEGNIVWRFTGPEGDERLDGAREELGALASRCARSSSSGAADGRRRSRPSRRPVTVRVSADQSLARARGSSVEECLTPGGCSCVTDSDVDLT